MAAIIPYPIYTEFRAFPGLFSSPPPAPGFGLNLGKLDLSFCFMLSCACCISSPPILLFNVWMIKKFQKNQLNRLLILRELKNPITPHIF